VVAKLLAEQKELSVERQKIRQQNAAEKLANNKTRRNNKTRPLRIRIN
jgi:hypothetical protein